MKKVIDDFFNRIPKCPTTWHGSLKGNKYPDKDKLFEIYIYILVAEYINITPWFIKNIVCKNNTFYFRGSPTKLWRDDKYGYVELKDSDGNEYELHLGVEVLGNSGVDQEVDIGLYPKEDAEYARVKKLDECNVKGKNALLAIECKNYDKTQLDKKLARTYVGQTIDITKDFYYGKIKGHKSRILISRKVDDNKKSVGKMLDYYNFVLIDDFNKSSTHKKDKLKGYIDNIKKL